MEFRCWKKNLVINLIFVCCVSTLSCDSSRFVYLDEKTFQKQVLYLKNALVSIVYEVDPTEKSGYRAHDTATPWPILRENRFTKRNVTSDELCHLILEVIKRNQRDVGKGWYPTYQIYVKYTVTHLYFIKSERYLDFIFDFTNRKIFSNGKSFVLTKNEADLIEMKLNALLEHKKGVDQPN